MKTMLVSGSRKSNRATQHADRFGWTLSYAASIVIGTEPMGDPQT
jgi:hypothetical protein